MKLRKIETTTPTTTGTSMDLDRQDTWLFEFHPSTILLTWIPWLIKVDPGFSRVFPRKTGPQQKTVTGPYLRV